MKFKTLKNRIKDDYKISLLTDNSIFLIKRVNLYTIDSLKDSSLSFNSLEQAEKFFNNLTK